MSIARHAGHPAEDLTANLMFPLGFDRETLATNREGYLTNRQKFALRGTLILQILMGTGAFLILIGGFLCSSINRTYGIDGATLFLVFVAVMSVSIGSVLIYRQHQWLSTQCVVGYTGRIKKYRENRHWWMRIINETRVAERAFKVGYFTYNAFVEGETYTIYWPSFADKRLLSAEHVLIEQK